VEFDETYHPVQVLRRIGGGDDPPAASGFNYGGVGPAASYVVRVAATTTPSNDCGVTATPKLSACFADPLVSPFPSPYCGDAAMVPLRDVAERSASGRSAGRG